MPFMPSWNYWRTMPINQYIHGNLLILQYLAPSRTTPLPYRAQLAIIVIIQALGHKEDPSKEIAFERTSKSVQKSFWKTFTKTRYSQKSKLLSIVGDSSKIDLSELEKIGPISDDYQRSTISPVSITLCAPRVDR